jgi:hypothetical protein
LQAVSSGAENRSETNAKQNTYNDANCGTKQLAKQGTNCLTAEVRISERLVCAWHAGAIPSWQRIKQGALSTVMCWRNLFCSSIEIMTGTAATDGSQKFE